MKLAQVQSVPRKRCPLCGVPLKEGLDRQERQDQWRKHRRQHYPWGEEDDQ